MSVPVYRGCFDLRRQRQPFFIRKTNEVNDHHRLAFGRRSRPGGGPGPTQLLVFRPVLAGDTLQGWEYWWPMPLAAALGGDLLWCPGPGGRLGMGRRPGLKAASESLADPLPRGGGVTGFFRPVFWGGWGFGLDHLPPRWGGWVGKNRLK